MFHGSKPKFYYGRPRCGWSEHRRGYCPRPAPPRHSHLEVNLLYGWPMKTYGLRISHDFTMDMKDFTMSIEDFTAENIWIYLLYIAICLVRQIPSPWRFLGNLSNGWIVIYPWRIRSCMPWFAMATINRNPSFKLACFYHTWMLWAIVQTSFTY